MGWFTPPGSTGCVPFPVHSEGQSVLCALGSSPRLWLSSFNCECQPQSSTTVPRTRVISFRADPTFPRILTASVSHLFLLLLGSSGSLPQPRDLPFHLVPTLGQDRETFFFFFFFFSSPISVFFLKLDQTPRTLLLPLPSFHQPFLLWPFLSDSWPLLECQYTHVIKEVTLLDALLLHTGRAQRSFLTLTLSAASSPHCQLCSLNPIIWVRVEGTI